MPIDPVKIPQNVYIEDRIVGPLTLKQVMLIALGGGFSYMMYAFAGKASGGNLGLVGTIVVWLPALLCTIFALVKVNDLSLLRIVFLSVEKLNKPPQRVWVPRRGLTIHIRTGGAQEVAKAEKEREQLKEDTATIHKAQSRIQELSSVLDRPLDPLPTPEEPALPEQLSEPDEADTEPLAPAQPNDRSDEPLPPVNRSDVRVDTHSEPEDGLAAYRDVFRDISPNP